MQRYSNTYITRVFASILQPVSGAQVIVTQDGAPATIYLDDEVTPITGLVTSSDGEFSFKAPNGEYIITLRKRGLKDEVLKGVLLFDPKDETGLVTSSALGAEDGAGKVGFQQTGPGAVPRSVEDELRERVSVTQFGSVTVAVLNAVIAATLDGTLTIPAGTYEMNGDIIIKSKGDANTGGFKLYGVGVIFTGSGRIIVDSCKRLTIEGLDAPNHDVHWRGAWWVEHVSMRYRNLVMGDAAGTSFSSTSWCAIRGGQSQAVILHANATSYYNEVTWDAHSMRGDAAQGFLGAAPFAFEFNGNANAQGWKYRGGDISYHGEFHRVGTGNTSGHIELVLDEPYLDSVVPVPTARDNTRIVVRAHTANSAVYVAAMPSATAGPVDLYRADRMMRHDASTAVNLIPNGDFKDKLSAWVGPGLPLAAVAGAVVTPLDGGFSGNYLNINQSATTGNSVRFRARALPYGGRATATIALRNADAGAKNLVCAFSGISPPITISDVDWTLVRLSNARLLAAGSTNDITIYTNDGTAFNVDVAYAGITMGEGAGLLIPSTSFRHIEYSETYDFPSVANGAQAFKDFTVPGVAMGDFPMVSCSGAVDSMQMSAAIVAANMVRVIMQNNSGAAVDQGNATYYLRIIKRNYV